MKTTLISSQQGTGKTLLISQIIVDDSLILPFSYITECVKHFHWKPANFKEEIPYLIYDDVYPHFDLLQLINFAKRNNKNLILITNLHHTEFSEYQIDINIGTQFNHK